MKNKIIKKLTKKDCKLNAAQSELLFFSMHQRTENLSKFFVVSVFNIGSVSAMLLFVHSSTPKEVKRHRIEDH